jgi:hypothetical protein
MPCSTLPDDKKHREKTSRLVAEFRSRIFGRSDLDQGAALLSIARWQTSKAGEAFKPTTVMQPSKPACESVNFVDILCYFNKITDTDNCFEHPSAMLDWS